jgi:hypothetical protein
MDYTVLYFTRGVLGLRLTLEREEEYLSVQAANRAALDWAKTRPGPAIVVEHNGLNAPRLLSRYGQRGGQVVIESLEG